jgi:hypothetical protein
MIIKLNKKSWGEENQCGKYIVGEGNSMNTSMQSRACSEDLRISALHENCVPDQGFFQGVL